MIVKELVTWIEIFRHGRAFKNYTKDHIALQLDRCIREGTILVINNKDGSVVGVICWSVRKNNSIYIEDVLTIEKGVLHSMMDVFNVRYPGFTICGTTKTGFKKFNPQRLLNLSPKYLTK